MERDLQAKASHRAKLAVPMSQRMQATRGLILIGVLLTIVGFFFPPLLILSLLGVIVGLVLIVTDLKHERQWRREYKNARSHAIDELRAEV